MYVFSSYNENKRRGDRPGSGVDHGKGSGRTYTNTHHVGGAWGALGYVLTVLHLHTCDWETPYRSPYPTPLLSPNPPGARCLPVHCVSHPFASAVLILPSFAHSARRSASSFPGMRTCDRTCVSTIPGLSLCKLQCPVLCA